MGYSCTASAGNALDFIMDMVTDPNGSSNSWTHEGTGYFFEMGREHEDGAVTGTVMRMVGENACRPAGSVRIAPDGKVVRFPHIPSGVRGNARAAHADGSIDHYRRARP
jgi:hypothetical protein